MNEAMRFEDIFDACLARVLAGEPPERAAAAYPEHAAEVLPLLRASIELRGAAQGPAPTDDARAHARERMLHQITATRSAGRARAPEQGGVGMMWTWFRKRPLVYQGLALLGGAALIGGVAAGASAAGAGPEPVRQFFGFSSSSSIRVEFSGVVTSVDVAGGSLTVATGDDERLVLVDGNTELSDSGDLIALADIQPGDFVEVKGTLQVDNSILATRVHRDDDLDDDDDDDRTPGPAATPFAPTPIATMDDDDDDDRGDDNSGPGNADDDLDDDNSGPGSSDDDVDDDNSGPGNGGDDDVDDNSGPGSSDDDLDDDNSGSGSGDDDAGDDHSGRGSGSDDPDDD